MKLCILRAETMCESFASSGGASAEQLASLLRSQADTTEALERHLQVSRGLQCSEGDRKR